jgi:hypothetical protein
MIRIPFADRIAYSARRDRSGKSLRGKIGRPDEMSRWPSVENVGAADASPKIMGNSYETVGIAARDEADVGQPVL